MDNTFNMYCDETCHLENDHKRFMVLGAVWCPIEKTKEISVAIRNLKVQNGLKIDKEYKWVNLSNKILPFAKALVDYFFENPDLHFRGITADKSTLLHKEFEQSHDDWYYKMYFQMLKVTFEPSSHYRIYLDIKDTKSSLKVEKLNEVLRNDRYDFSGVMIERVQTVKSHEIEQMQIVDFIIGAMQYCLNNKCETKNAKSELVNYIQTKYSKKFNLNSLFKESKFNVFNWKGQHDL